MSSDLYCHIEYYFLHLLCVAAQSEINVCNVCTEVCVHSLKMFFIKQSLILYISSVMALCVSLEAS